MTIPVAAANCQTTSTPPTCTQTLSLTLTAPSLSVAFGNQELILSWSTPLPSGFNIVTGYNVYYMEQGGSTWTKISVGNVNSYTLTGLTNGTTYDVKVTAVASPMYFINVTALDDYTTPHESHLLVPDVSAPINCSIPSCESPGSNTATNSPQPIAPFPDLPDQGHCFIATAAYGSQWEPQVKILRAFRDEYLEHYNLGRRFIAWYYHASPPWAQYLNEHVWLKPMVRVVLIPAVGFAYFFVTATGTERLLIFLLVALGLIGGTFVVEKSRRSRD
ncbi:MAG TPA: fibronectin type III domain-containing protein [Nitrospiria bacterium]|nr:fibronectin type III domain-containing protein [Nitrospiria bacterium]